MKIVPININCYELETEQLTMKHGNVCSAFNSRCQMNAVRAQARPNHLNYQYPSRLTNLKMLPSPYNLAWWGHHSVVFPLPVNRECVDTLATRISETGIEAIVFGVVPGSKSVNGERTLKGCYPLKDVGLNFPVVHVCEFTEVVSKLVLFSGNPNRSEYSMILCAQMDNVLNNFL